MAHKKGQGSSRNGRDSNAQRRGVKRFGGEQVRAGNIIVRQLGTVFQAGHGRRSGQRLYALRPGRWFREVRSRRSADSNRAIAQLGCERDEAWQRPFWTAKTLAEKIRAEIAAEVGEFTRRTGVKPCLAAVLVGEDPASQVYVRNKQKACEQNGLTSRLHRLGAETTTDGTLGPDRSSSTAIPACMASWCNCRCPRASIRPAFWTRSCPRKDVDAFHPENVGRIVQGRPLFLPCTPHGIQQILLRHQIPTAGCACCRGRPQRDRRQADRHDAHAEGAGRRCHGDRLPQPQSRSALDHPRGGYSHRGHRPGELRYRRHGEAGCRGDRRGHQSHGRGLVGDVDFGPVSQVAGCITPVPGGVGPLTITMLLHNTLLAARLKTSGNRTAAISHSDDMRSDGH